MEPFIKEEFNNKDRKYYMSKEKTIKRYQKLNLYGIENKAIYGYVMKRLISYIPMDTNLQNYYYLFFLIPKDILLIYYIILKERNSQFLSILSDLKEFLIMVLRLGGIK